MLSPPPVAASGSRAEFVGSDDDPANGGGESGVGDGVGPIVGPGVGDDVGVGSGVGSGSAATSGTYSIAYSSGVSKAFTFRSGPVRAGADITSPTCGCTA